MTDRNRLSFAGMLHDVGKAMVPVAILEKPGALDADEMAIMKKHPEYGIEALKSGVDLQPEMIDIVIHHHEYLDGSGYPHGLQAHEIADLVRITTICRCVQRADRTARLQAGDAQPEGLRHPARDGSEARPGSRARVRLRHQAA